MNALEIGLRASVIVLVALAASAALRRRSAALRHWVLAAGILSAAAVAPLGLALPAWDLPASALAGESSALAGREIGQVPVNGTRPSSVTRQPASATLISYERIANSMWAAGFVVSILMMMISLVRLHGVTRRAVPVVDERWLTAARDLSSSFDLREGVVLLQTGLPAMLGTWGWWRPLVLLPAECESWSDARIRIVLGHELAHVRRADWAIQMAAEVVRAAFWYNPLLWIACARLRREGEQACDDAVLEAGVPAAEYASHLLEIARVCRSRTPVATLVPMARLSTLERRITAMLNTTLARTRPARRTLMVAAAVILGITLTTASFRAKEQAGPMPLTGTAYDVTGAVLPGVALTLDDADANRLTATTDANGRFEFGVVAPGRYQIGSRLPGFMSLAQDVRLESARHWDVTLTIPVGTLQETITVTEQRPSTAARAERAPVRIGGNIKPPRKLVDVRPVYPQAMRDAGLEGVVSLTAMIDVEGRVTSARVIGSPAHPDLGRAAVDAVRQWQFSPTLLNGEAVEVLMNVQVAFSLQD
ncbi:MAG: M56 family metallopeptidase [Vicinamibacterales bacterium]|jgi:TonB family protein